MGFELAENVEVASSHMACCGIPWCCGWWPNAWRGQGSPERHPGYGLRRAS
jgi:hypothetical protein